MLTEAKIKRLTAKTKAYQEKDIPTLALVVQKTGRKTFIQRLVIQGQQVDLRIGDWPATTLPAARKISDANRAVARAGDDPRIDAAIGKIPTFHEAQERVIDLHRGNWRSVRTEKIWRREMKVYAASLMSMSVNKITVQHLERLLSPIWTVKPVCAKRVKQRIGLVLKWSYAHRYRDGNPVELLDMILPRQRRQKKHHAALPYDQIAEALNTVAELNVWWAAKAALRFTALTGARSGEALNMRWDDIDDGLWIVPAHKMKMGREHRVRLSTQAQEIIEDARGCRDGSGLVFPSQRGKIQEGYAMSRLFRQNNLDGTVHGLRSGLRDWCAEKTNFPRTVAEYCLAHYVSEAETEAAYMRSDFLEQRGLLLQQWGDFIAGEFVDNVVSIARTP